MFILAVFLCAKIISVRFGVKLYSLSREWNGRNVSLNTKKPDWLQEELFFSNYFRVLDFHFAALGMAVDMLLTEIIIISTQIRVW